MDFSTSIKTCFSKYAVFSGRASRSEFWYFFLFGSIGGAVTLVIDSMIFGFAIDDSFGPTHAIFTIITFLPYLSVGARRLHDINRSGWWQLISLTGFGVILLIVWWAMEGKNK